MVDVDDSLSAAAVSSGGTGEIAGRADLRQRATAGVFIIAVRGLLILFVGFGGTVVLARLLTPHDFGIVAIGTTLVLVIALLSDGGLGGALIRRPEPPTGAELEALMGIQLSVTIGMALVIAFAAIPFGETGAVIALMVLSMPFVALQFPGRILLERSLSYRPLALVEIVQVLTYYLWAVGFVFAGFGVWGLASATVVMRAAAAITMACASPVVFVRPGFSWGRVKPLLGFGVRFQAASATWLVRDQGLTAGIAVIASTATLGLWTLARRLLEVPYLVFESLLRVSLPTMSKLVAAKEDPTRLIERAVSMGAVAGGLILTGLAASAPGLIPGLFGEEWREASAAIPGACLGLAIGGSITVATQGYLYAVDEPSIPLRASVLEAIVWLGVALPLLPLIGIAAVGIGWFASAVAEAIALWRGTRRRTGVSLFPPLIAPTIIGTVAASMGWVVADRGGADLRSGILGGVLASLLFQAGLLAVRRTLLFDTYRFAARSMRAAVSRPAALT